MKIIFIVSSIMLVIILVVVDPVQADTAVGDVEITPEVIEIYAVQGKSDAKATIYITPKIDGLTKIKISSSDLLDEINPNNDQPILYSDQVILTPAVITHEDSTEEELVSFTVDEAYLVSINIENINGHGDWTGQINIDWFGESSSSLTVDIVIHMATVPVLELESVDEVVVSGTRNQQKVESSVTIHETGGGSSVTGLTEFVQALHNSDKSAAFPSDGIDVDLDKDLASNGRTEMDITFNLSEVKKSGNYSGKIIVQSENAVDLMIPVKVTIKDFWVGPLVVIYIGAFLGFGLNYYRENVLSDDKVRVKIKLLKNHLVDDKEFNKYCGFTVEEQVKEAEDYLNQDNSTEANKALKVAEDLWKSWYEKNRKYILTNIRALESLLSDIESIEDLKNVSIVKAYSESIRDLLDSQIPDYVSKPEDLEERIKDDETGYEAILDKIITIFNSLKLIKQDLAKTNSEENYVMDVSQLEEFNQSLIDINNSFAEITSVPVVAELSEMQQKIKELRENIKNAFTKGTAAKINIQLYSEKTNLCLSTLKTQDDGLKKAISYVKKYGLTVTREKEKDNHWIDAEEWSRKSWYGVRACFFVYRSIKEIRKGDTTEKWNKVIKCETDLINLLINTKNYDLSFEDFYSNLNIKAEALQNSISTVTGNPFELDWEGRRKDDKLRERKFTIRVTHAVDLQQLPESADLKVIEIDRKIRKYCFWNAAYWTPERRLFAYKYSTLILGAILFTIVGFKELYSDVADFGVNGFWDYLKLVLWGFGAEVSSDTISGLIKGWGLPFLNSNQNK